MNGTTTIDATLNPCSAAMDRRTYGWRQFCASVYGHRLVWLRLGNLVIDIYWGGWGRPLFNSIPSATGLLTPFGAILWLREPWR